jgi:hypothetical protein
MDTNLASSFEAMDWGSWITAVATAVLAILTFIYVWLTRRILDSQAMPCVIVSVVHDDKRPTILQLLIRNIGLGLAHDITFNSSRPIPDKAWGIVLADAKEATAMDSGPLIDGIPALGPGEERRIDWGQFGGLMKNIGEEPIIVKCNFKKDGKPIASTTCKLEVKSFEGTCASERDPGMKCARELEKIAKELNHLGTGFHRLKVELLEKPNKPADEES